jgi:hypothetical protein
MLCLGSNVLALDLVIPDFAGCDQSAAVLWEFEDGNSATGETSDKPSLILYASEPPDACFGFRTYGSDYEGGCDPNNAFAWDTNGTVVLKGEETVVQPIPAGLGSNLTVQVQMMWQGPNYPEPNGTGILFELWSAYPEKPNAPCELREGEWFDGIGNEAEFSFDLPPIAEVNNVEGAWRHTIWRHTFANVDEEVTHFNFLIFGFEQGTAGVRIDEIVVDMVVHDGETPTVCPGRDYMLIPRAGQARNPVPANFETHVMPDTNLGWAPDPCLAGPLTYDVWFGTDPNMANNTKIASGIGANTVDPCAGDLAAGTGFYWRVDTIDPNGGGRDGIDFKFTTWGFADDPDPGDGEPSAKASLVLSWVEDAYADSRDIYFGTDETAVGNADTSDTTGIYRGSTAPLDPCDPNRNTYAVPEVLNLLTPHFWRIDEVNSSVAVPGDIWGFTTQAFFDVDDFERYGSQTDLWNVWDDYWTNGTDAEIFFEADANLTRSGNGMRYKYLNTTKSGGKYVGSSADADVIDLLAGTDWTVQGIRSILVHFLGTTTNSVTGQEHMWLELEDTSSNVGLKLYDGDMNNITVAQWQEWNIDLADANFSSVSLANMSKIRLGFGGYARTAQSAASGSGLVYIDDIQLHPQRCRPDVVAWDIAEDDCKTDEYDIQVLAGDWLIKDYQVFPSPPDRNDLIVEYLFTGAGDYNDTSGNGRHGQPTATLTSVANGYLTIQNTGGYVDIPFGASNPFHGPNDFSVVIEYRSSDQVATALLTSSDPCLPMEWDLNGVDYDAAFGLYSPMALVANQVDPGGPPPPELTFTYDNFYKAGTEVLITDAGGIGAWHTVAVTYDADGGICPAEPWDPNACPTGTVSGLVTVYIDATKGADPLIIDPNIPVDPNYDVVRIGDGYTPLHGEDWGFGPHIGDFNEILIYDVALTEAEVYYLSGVTGPTYVANTSLANVVPKSPPGGPYNPSNIDIVNFVDYDLLGEHWLEAPLLWP